MQGRGRNVEDRKKVLIWDQQGDVIHVRQHRAWYVGGRKDVVDVCEWPVGRQSAQGGREGAAHRHTRVVVRSSWRPGAVLHK